MQPTLTLAIMECPVTDAKGPAPHPIATTTSSSIDGVDQCKLVEIPEPPKQYFGLIGHMPDIDPGFPIRSFWNLMDMYGPIFKLDLGGSRIIRLLLPAFGTSTPFPSAGTR